MATLLFLVLFGYSGFLVLSGVRLFAWGLFRMVVGFEDRYPDRWTGDRTRGMFDGWE